MVTKPGLPGPQPGPSVPGQGLLSPPSLPANLRRTRFAALRRGHFAGTDFLINASNRAGPEGQTTSGNRAPPIGESPISALLFGTCLPQDPCPLRSLLFFCLTWFCLCSFCSRLPKSKLAAGGCSGECVDSAHPPGRSRHQGVSAPTQCCLPRTRAPSTPSNLLWGHLWELPNLLEVIFFNDLF